MGNGWLYNYSVVETSASVRMLRLARSADARSARVV